MKKILFFCVASAVLASVAGPAYAQTKKELQFMIKEEITDEEFGMMLKIREATGRNWVDIFDNSIEPLREEVSISNESMRKYILPSKESEEEAQKAAEEKAKEKEEKLSIDVNAARVGRKDDVKPIQIERGAPRKDKKPRRIYPREYKYKERFKKEEAKSESQVEEATENQKMAVDGDSKTSLRDRLKDVRSLEKRRKEVDRKPPTYRSYERRKKVEDYNRTKKRNRFGGQRLDDEIEDDGFSTRAFKKKAFGPNIIYEEDQPKSAEGENEL